MCISYEILFPNYYEGLLWNHTYLKDTDQLGGKGRLTRKDSMKTAKTSVAWCGEDNKEGSCAKSWNAERTALERKRWVYSSTDGGQDEL